MRITPPRCARWQALLGTGSLLRDRVRARDVWNAPPARCRSYTSLGKPPHVNLAGASLAALGHRRRRRDFHDDKTQAHVSSQNGQGRSHKKRTVTVRWAASVAGRETALSIDGALEARRSELMVDHTLRHFDAGAHCVLVAAVSVQANAYRPEQSLDICCRDDRCAAASSHWRHRSSERWLHATANGHSRPVAALRLMHT